MHPRCWPWAWSRNAISQGVWCRGRPQGLIPATSLCSSLHSFLPIFLSSLLHKAVPGISMGVHGRRRDVGLAAWWTLFIKMGWISTSSILAGLLGVKQAAPFCMRLFEWLFKLVWRSHWRNRARSVGKSSNRISAQSLLTGSTIIGLPNLIPALFLNQQHYARDVFRFIHLKHKSCCWEMNSHSCSDILLTPNSTVSCAGNKTSPREQWVLEGCDEMDRAVCRALLQLQWAACCLLHWAHRPREELKEGVQLILVSEQILFWVAIYCPPASLLCISQLRPLHSSAECCGPTVSHLSTFCQPRCS